MKIQIPEVCLVLLVGVSGSGKSSFAMRHFRSTEVLSSDFCRGLVSDDENDQSATKDAFEVLNFIAGKRLEARRLTVVDATSVRKEDRRRLVQLAREHDYLCVAIVLDIPADIAVERNKGREDRDFGARVVHQQHKQLKRGLRGIRREGFSRVYTLREEADFEDATIERQRLWTDRRHLGGPFDIIGDVHGCHDELLELLGKLGYRVEGTREEPVVTPPEGRQAVFVGDLIDRGPDSPGVLRLAMAMVAAGSAICIPGNHEAKLVKKLRGKKVKLTHGLQETVDQLAREPGGFEAEVLGFLDALVSHFVLDEGRLVVAHAGLPERYQGRASGRVRAFCLFGETSGETDEFGLPVRYDWARDYRGEAMVVYGHTPVPEVEWVNRTICIDTGCVFGGKLTALRYPERELVQVEARETWYEPVRPLVTEAGGERPPELLDMEDVAGKRIVDTRLQPRVTLREENAAAALEVMSRFAIDPRWLIYLPPTMAPPKTAPGGSAELERPEEVFDYFRRNGVERVICQEKHMGSRAVVLVGRDAEALARRFQAPTALPAVAWTRTGRRFFHDEEFEAQLFPALSEALGRARLFDELDSDWVCLDAEILPWSFKAEPLIQSQYAAVGAAAEMGLADTVDAVRATWERGAAPDDLLTQLEGRLDRVRRYGRAWRSYCRSVAGPGEIRVAPFHILASEGQVHMSRAHDWHMEVAARLAGASELLVATPHRVVELADEAACDAARRWWDEITAAGSEGMVVKPLEWITRGKRGLVQPALKCRGREYLRIIYGPEYDAPDNIERLRPRGLSHKQSMALREFALGHESLHRFVEGEPLWRVHECVFGVLTMESEPVDPRL